MAMVLGHNDDHCIVVYKAADPGTEISRQREASSSSSFPLASPRSNVHDDKGNANVTDAANLLKWSSITEEVEGCRRNSSLEEGISKILERGRWVGSINI